MAETIHNNTALQTATAAWHLGDEYRPRHNRRDPTITSHEKHIDNNGYHNTIIHQDIRDAYDEIFGEAVEEYNSKQKRADRKIKNYYEKIAAPYETIKAEQRAATEFNDKNREAIKAGEIKRQPIPEMPKNTRKPCYELICGCYLAQYRTDENGEIVRDTKTDAPIIEHPNKTPRELSEPICDEYLEGFIKRNPNLSVVGAYFHDDEPNGDGGHIHIDFIPFHHASGRGLSVQHGMEKALKEQGSGTLQEWTEQEKKELENIAEAHGLKVIHSKGTAHMDKKELDAYNKQRDRELEAAKIKKEIEQAKLEAIAVQEEISRLKDEKEDAEKAANERRAQLEQENEKIQADIKAIRDVDTILKKNYTELQSDYKKLRDEMLRETEWLNEELKQKSAQVATPEALNDRRVLHAARNIRVKDSNKTRYNVLLSYYDRGVKDGRLKPIREDAIEQVINEADRAIQMAKWEKADEEASR